MQFRASSPIAFEKLEPRQLRAGDAPVPTDGTDFHVTLDAAGEAVVTAGRDPVARQSFSEFKWFDGTAGQAIMNAGGTAFEHGMCDSWYMWPWTPDGGKVKGGEADEQSTRLLARLAVEQGVEMVVIDNEMWHFDIRHYSRETVDLSIARTKEMLGWIRDERPQLKIGIYNYMSHSDDSKSVIWEIGAPQLAQGQEWWVQHMPEYANAFAGWQATSEYMRSLSESVDYVFPSIYTQTTNPDEWEMSARITIEDSRRYGKPVIPFIWPLYHDSMGGIAHTEIPTAFWERQLDLVREYADGAFIWNGWGPTPGSNWVATTVAKTTPPNTQSQALMAPLPAHASSPTGATTKQRRNFFNDEPIDGELLAA